MMKKMDSNSPLLRLMNYDSSESSSSSDDKEVDSTSIATTSAKMLPLTSMIDESFQIVRECDITALSCEEDCDDLSESDGGSFASLVFSDSWVSYHDDISESSTCESQCDVSSCGSFTPSVSEYFDTLSVTTSRKKDELSPLLGVQNDDDESENDEDYILRNDSVKKVRFGTVNIREYGLTVGALSAARDSCPLQLTWEQVKPEVCIDLRKQNHLVGDDRPALRRTGKCNREIRGALTALSLEERRERIANVQSISMHDVEILEYEMVVDFFQKSLSASRRNRGFPDLSFSGRAESSQDDVTPRMPTKSTGYAHSSTSNTAADPSDLPSKPLRCVSNAA